MSRKPQFCHGLLALLMHIAAGCNAVHSDYVTKIQQLEDQVAEHNRTIAAQNEAIRIQAETIERLRQMPDGLDLGDLIHVARIEIERLSGGFDEDGDGIDDGVLIHLRLFDQDGFAMRATGRVETKLFDLANPEQSQLLGTSSLTEDELRRLWLGRLWTSHYTIPIMWSQGIEPPAHAELTALVTFTDSLSQKSFTSQAVLPVQGPQSVRAGIERP